jgi:hypothetical protein
MLIVRSQGLEMVVRGLSTLFDRQHLAGIATAILASLTGIANATFTEA